MCFANKLYLQAHIIETTLYVIITKATTRSRLDLKVWVVVGADRGEAWPNVKNEVVLLEKTRPLRAHKRKNHSAISALKLPFDPVCGEQIEKKQP